MPQQAATAPALSLSISTSDLTNTAQLKKLLQENEAKVFNFEDQIEPYLKTQVQSTPNGTETDITLSGSGNWKTQTGIGFGLSGSAKCSLKVITSGAVLTYAPDLSSKPTSSLPSKDYSGSAYIMVCLDFQISGSASGAGNVSGIGISGNVKGSLDSSVTFCHLVSGTTLLADAVKDAFEHFVFVLEPSCADDMSVGDIAQLNFNGSLGCSLDVSYGIANVSFSGPGVASVLNSATKGVAQLSLPSGKIEIGADAKVTFTHTDDFTAIVEKQDASDAFLYVMRARKNDSSEGVSVSAKVTITNNPGVNVDTQKLLNAVNGITGGGGGQQAAQVAGDLANSLNGKLNTWINDTTSKGASLGFEWDQQHAVSMLFKYEVNLQNAALRNASWTDLCRGDLAKAMTEGGLVPESGSGISNQLSHSFTLSFQLFNFFAASSKSTYFQNTSLTVTQDGGLRYSFDIGKETEVDVNKSKKICQVHFVASIDESTAKTLSGADVDLVLELRATNNKREAGRIGDTVGFIPPNQQVNIAQKAMQQFVSANPSGTLDLVCTLKPSAYGRLSCSEYVGKKPPANQQQDSENWTEFHDASAVLLNLSFISSLSYSTWQEFNALCVYGERFSGTPDRRSEGNPNAVPPSFWQGVDAPPALIAYFLLNSAQFMNLCDDLHELAGLSGTNSPADDISAYNDMLTELVELILKRDVNNDYSKPAIAALLALSNPQNVSTTINYGNNSMTCKLTLQ